LWAGVLTSGDADRRKELAEAALDAQPRNGKVIEEARDLLRWDRFVMRSNDNVGVHTLPT
jgi:hypothetical protein